MGCTLYVPGEKGTCSHVAMDVRCVYLVTRIGGD